ncbi:protein PXR1-like [Solanum pennellii]|uniref:Protein PXR1-like n=1 Tax=Solanum pennellii TaxID=28526 RepID=A0ABM1UZV9_SOLPN|nr:protein PXR1-like [Solanum pennellii]XP_027769027.1 protein PXR1-like [Solanum pennellii]XP_027769028.1 protein PXR1-like [Solanum pennellii]XP_027769029.1 protein PXR1-like [Solanum pennellii]
MKRVSAKVESTIPISLSAAAKSLSKFAASDHEASHAVSLYLQSAADSFNRLVKIQQKLSVKKEHDVKVEEISEKNEDIPNGFRENKKSKNLVKEENSEAEPKTKNSSKIDKVKGHKLIKTEPKLDIGEEEIEKSNKNELESVKIVRELELKEVKEDSMTSRDKKKKKKKKDRDEVVKVEQDGKSMDTDAGSASAEQSSKKKSKKRRIEGDE